MEANIINNIQDSQTMINDSVHQFFDVIDAVAVLCYDEKRRVVYWNEGSENLYGYSQEEALGKKIEELIIPESMSEAVKSAHYNWVHKGIEVPAAEITLRHKKGYDVGVFSSHVMFENSLHEKQIYCIDVNLNDVRQAKAQAAFKEHMLKAVLESTPDLFFLMEESGKIIDFHTSNLDELYVTPDQFIGKSMVDVLPIGVGRKLQTHIDKTIEGAGISNFEYELKLPQGLFHYEARISHLPEYQQVVIIVRDITEQHKTDEIIRHHAYFDTLTSLPNRFLALERLTQMMSEAKINDEKTAVLFLDLDDFKKVNDSLGHEIGDKLLIESAHRLSRAVRAEDTVGRLGGDEFIVLLNGLTHDHTALAIAEDLLRIFRQPFYIDSRELILTLSIGIAIYPENGKTSSDLLRNADTAMYQAKALGRNTHSFFTQEMNVIMLRRFEIEEQMRGALERNEFEVFYQPKIDVKNGKIISAEALLRWHNKTLGNITPDEFIPIAEHTGLIIPIGQFVLKQSLLFLKKWQSADNTYYSMAVNLSPRQFRDTSLLNLIQSLLKEMKVRPQDLEFEITEGVLMIGKSHIDRILLDIHNLGIKLSMDDFGTGYSSLSYLRQYAFDILKVDRSFINGITTTKEDCDLVKGTIALAHSLNLTVVAEGVETIEQLSLLQDLGCDYVQGYYFSKPLPDQDFLTFSHTYQNKK